MDVHPILRRVVNGDCYGSVLLDNDLWQSLTAMNGHEVPWVYGCALDHSRDEDHGAPVYQADGEPQRWLRWPDTGPARVEHVEPSAPGRHSKPVGSPPPQPPSQSTTAGGSQTHRRGGGEVTANGSEAEALWAIAAAVERLADVLARLGKPPGNNGI